MEDPKRGFTQGQWDVYRGAILEGMRIAEYKEAGRDKTHFKSEWSSRSTGDQELIAIGRRPGTSRRNRAPRSGSGVESSVIVLGSGLCLFPTHPPTLPNYFHGGWADGGEIGRVRKQPMSWRSDMSGPS